MHARSPEQPCTAYIDLSEVPAVGPVGFRHSLCPWWVGPGRLRSDPQILREHVENIFRCHGSGEEKALRLSATFRNELP